MDHNRADLPIADAGARIVVAMSGGVDSSVAAALLVRQGFEVVGVTLQLYPDTGGAARAGTCCAGRDIRDARAVASALGVPHYVLDYESRFRERVIEPFAESYLRGETPIPCVSCNSRIKFADLLDTARDLGAAALATGHYVRSRPASGGGRALHRARDLDRDQSYFLYATTREQLDLLRFPLGDLRKSEVRDLGRALGLAVAEKADSQDICFVPTGRYADLVSRLRPEASRSGEIVDLDGRVLGRHAGVHNYTVGQRRGLGLAESSAGRGEPLFVVRLDAARARVVVGPRRALDTLRVDLRDVNWIGDGPLVGAGDRAVAVKLRSTRPPAAAALRTDATGTWVELASPEGGVAPGQACVFYESAAADARVLGGGIIRASVAAAEPDAARAVA